MTGIIGLVNFRDVGGLPIGDDVADSNGSGGLTRTGVLFRSDAPAALTADGLAGLAATPIGTVVDLRTPAERTSAPDTLPDARPFSRVDLSILAGSMTDLAESVLSRVGGVDGTGDGQASHDDVSPAGAAADTHTTSTTHAAAHVLPEIPTLGEMYVAMLAGDAAPFVQIARLIAATSDDAQTAVLVHCTAGKDRTGVATALMLGAVGVSRAAIVADYAATEHNLAGPWADRMLQMIASLGVPVTPELRTLATQSPASAMETTLDWLDAHHGGAAAYLRSGGLTEHELATLTRRLTADRAVSPEASS